MTSDRKLRANRANSLRSIGPKRAAGLAASARNARRHGLRIPVLSDPSLSAEVEVMAQKIASNSPPELVELARRVAEAEIDVLRVRRVRSDMISCELTIERSDISRGGPRNTAGARKSEQASIMERVGNIKTLPPHFGPEFAIIDRYERRALSRRKFAIRAFDEARAATPVAGATSPILAERTHRELSNENKLPLRRRARR